MRGDLKRPVCTREPHASTSSSRSSSMPIVRDSSLRPEVGTRSAYRRFTGYLMPSWLTHLSRRSPPTTVTSARRGCLLMGSARTSSVLVRSKRDRRVAFGAVDHAAIAGSIAKAKIFIFILDMLLFLCNFLNRRCGLFTVRNKLQARRSLRTFGSLGTDVVSLSPISSQFLIF